MGLAVLGPQCEDLGQIYPLILDFLAFWWFVTFKQTFSAGEILRFCLIKLILCKKHGKL